MILPHADVNFSISSRMTTGPLFGTQPAQQDGTPSMHDVNYIPTSISVTGLAFLTSAPMPAGTYRSTLRSAGADAVTASIGTGEQQKFASAAFSVGRATPATLANNTNFLSMVYRQTATSDSAVFGNAAVAYTSASRDSLLSFGSIKAATLTFEKANHQSVFVPVISTDPLNGGTTPVFETDSRYSLTPVPGTGYFTNLTFVTTGTARFPMTILLQKLNVSNFVNLLTLTVSGNDAVWCNCGTAFVGPGDLVQYRCTASSWGTGSFMGANLMSTFIPLLSS